MVVAWVWADAIEAAEVECNRMYRIDMKGGVNMYRGFYGRGLGFGPGRGLGRGFGGRGRGMGLGPNFSGVCRFNPSLPSRRSMMFGAPYYGVANNNDVMPNEVEVLKQEAAYLKSELDAINEQLNNLEDKD